MFRKGHNRPGANGVVAGEIVAMAPGDGHTLSMATMTLAINPLTSDDEQRLCTGGVVLAV